MSASDPPSIRLRLVALTTCATLALASFSPSVAMAAPEDGSGTAEAETNFRRGQAKYETADYNGAIELWTEAYALVDPAPENASIKALLIFNLAQAHVKAFELDEDRIHLEQAQQQLQSFKDNLSLLYEDQATIDEEVAKVDETLAEIDAMIAALDEPAPAPEPEPEPEPEPPPPSVEPPNDEPVDTDGRSGKPLVISGAVLLGLGAAFAGVGITGAVIGSGANDISELEPRSSRR